MAEYVERKAAYEDFEKCNSENPKWTPSRVKALIARQKAADVAPVRHGRWLFVTAGQQASVWYCSKCGRSVAITCDEELRQGKLEKEYPFCHCGAKMFEEK